RRRVRTTRARGAAGQATIPVDPICRDRESHLAICQVLERRRPQMRQHCSMTCTDAAQTSCEPFHFGEANGELLGIYHAPPVDRQRGSALLLCYPFGKEY